MLLGIVLARLLEPSVFGEFVFVTATLAFLMIPVSFSTAQLLISDAGRTSGLLSRVLGLAALVCAVKMLLLLAYVAFNLWQGNTVRAGVAAIAGLPLVFADYITALRCDLEGIGLFKQNFVVQILDLFAHAAVAITLVCLGYGVYGLAWGGLAGSVPQALLYSYLSGRKSFSLTLSVDQLAHQFRTGFWLWIGSVASNWYSRIDKIMVGRFGGVTELGYYNRALNYAPISHLVLNSLLTNAAVRGLAAKENIAEKRSLFIKTISCAFLGAIATGFFWSVMAPFLLPFVFGQQWTPAVPVFQVLGWIGASYVFSSGTAIILYAEQRYTLIGTVNCIGLLLLCLTLFTFGRYFTLTALTAGWILLIVTLFVGMLMTILAAWTLARKDAQEKYC